MARIRADKPAASCVGCFAWGQLPGRFCRGCYTYGQGHAVAACAGCRREVAVHEEHGYCRLCRAQATWAIKAAGVTGRDSLLLPFLLKVKHQQLFFANMQRPRNGGPPVGRAGRRQLRVKPPAAVPPPTTNWHQPELVTAARDFGQFDRRQHADLDNPRLVRARREARALGETRGWTRWIVSDVDRALVIVLSGHVEGEVLRHSEIFPPLRTRGLSVGHTAEVLDRLGLFTDDRTPSVDGWLARKLDGVAPGLRRIAEDWARTLLDGGPRTQPRALSTARGYLHEVRPALVAWSDRYDHLREVTRKDVLDIRDAATGKQRENRIVALRSLFRHAKKTGQIFKNPTTRIPIPRHLGPVLQPLDQADVDESIAAATRPHARLILALAAIHAARPGMIRALQLDDVDLGNRLITIADHIRPLDELTHHTLAEWLDYRRTRWPNTANPHLLITQKSAVGRGPVGKLWATEATRNLPANLERLRVDRQLEEALTHGPDPLHLALVFGIDEKTAIRYAASAQQLLESTLVETDPARSS